MKLPVSAAILFAPGLALACAVCARDTSPLAGLFIAGMIGAPYAVGYLAVRAIREGDRPAGPGAQP
jgi:predicted Kef-type K+ transport protein